MEAKKISKKREEEITRDYETFFNSGNSLTGAPSFSRKWDKINGMFVKFSLYLDNECSSSSNGKTNLLKY